VAGSGFFREGLRIVRLLLGTFLYALGIVMTIKANLGLSPWDVFHQGLAARLGISFGVASIVVSGVLIAATAFMKEHVGIGTLLNMVLVGVFIDILMATRRVPRIPEMHSFPTGVLMMVAGLFVIAFASYFYIGAGYGAGPRDSLMVVLARRTGRAVGLCRAVVEGTALLFGWLLGGRAGVGTVIAAFGAGIAIQSVFSLLRFDVRKVRQELLLTTYARIKRLM
jgi:uncharacterized membrane protein YczE